MIFNSLILAKSIHIFILIPYIYRYMAKLQKLSQEALLQEEAEAQERGLTIFQLRHVKKLKAMREQRRIDAIHAKKKARDKQKKADKLKQQRIKAREKARLLAEKQRLREKEQRKKDKLKAKHAQEKLIKKRKPGRPKKRGPKINYYKRKIKRLKALEPKAPRPTFDYKIVACRNGKQFKYIDRFTNSDDAYTRIEQLLKESEKVIIPSEMSHRDTVKDVVYEYLILEKNRYGDKENAMLRNEFGKLIEHKTTSDIWVILDKFRYNEEELFWVWGYNNRTDRKDFAWIYENIVKPSVETKYDVIRVMLYKNKVIIKNDREELQMIICKCIDDAVRVYNKMEEFVKEDKIKQIFFMGSYSNRGERKVQLENEIMELTGWDRPKVQMTSTSKHVRS